MDDELLTTAEAARIAGVGTSSVKRWADLKLLPCVKTAGGHRRYKRAELERFLHEHGGVQAEDTRETWLDVLVHGDALELQAAILLARSRLGAWHHVGDELGAAAVEIGARWKRGELSILEEHVASEKLGRALARAVESLPIAPDAPISLLATTQEDDHTLGLSLAELCLREAGWRCVWTGRRTPVGELVRELENGGVRMLAVSASEYSSDPAPLRSEADALGRACRACKAELVLGGSGAWPDAPSYGIRVRSLADLYAFASSHAP